MTTDVSDEDKPRTSYAAQRTRLLAKRKIEEIRVAHAREALKRIDREIAALGRERMRLDRQGMEAAAEDIVRAVRQFASTATR